VRKGRMTTYAVYSFWKRNHLGHLKPGALPSPRSVNAQGTERCSVRCSAGWRRRASDPPANRGSRRDFSPSEVEDVYYCDALERAGFPSSCSGRLRTSGISEARGRVEAACRRGAMAAMILTNLAFHAG